MRSAGFLLLLCAAVRAEPTAAELLQSKDVMQRLKGVQLLAQEGAPDAERLLHAALKDRDWEVLQRATEALAVRGGRDSVPLLVNMALQGPTRRIRVAAATSLRELDAQAASLLLQKKLRGPTLHAAAEALAIIAYSGAAKELQRTLKSKDGSVRAAAVRALGSFRQPERIEDFADLLQDRDIEVRAAAVQALADTRDPRAVAPLRDALQEERMTAVMERRHIAALYALLSSIPDTGKRDLQARFCARMFGVAGNVKADARYARLLGELGRKGAAVGPVEDYIHALTQHGLGHGDDQVRCASAASLARIGAVAALERLRGAAQHSSSKRVRFHALRAVVRLEGDAALPLLLDRIRNDDHLSVRGEAAVICGKRGLAKSAGVLVEALDDPAWEVCTAAAVSLGKLRNAQAVGPLTALYKHKDWRRRAAAIVGLGWIKQKEAVPVLIQGLKDRELTVKATALEFLRHISGRGDGPKIKTWQAWWHKHEPNFAFRDPGEEAKQAKKYGYAVAPRKVYEDLDIIVLQTRKGGDNIQSLLEDYKIEHRIVRAASVHKIGLHPHGLFVANCPGEIVDRDVERIRWYVRAGGYLFASCWALTHTVERAFPGVVRKWPTRAQVLDTVAATPCPVHSPFTAGVFDEHTLPLYELVGSHLIEVLDPERFEVLIDSPECATRWGEGNLAGWFTVGHGVVLDSANHFDMQGMRAVRLKDAKERMAFAMDRLGYDYTQLRELAAEGVFARQPLAVKRTRDLSIFRFITTFVRQKRLADQQ
ncbi:MAG: HEAT repeat domain-containing protein [Planctomycetota bacterium]|nr:HEAT repeat domain-containing protein [Planctomycetota bacterium]